MTKRARQTSSTALRKRQMKHCNMTKIHRRRKAESAPSLQRPAKMRRKHATEARRKIVEKTNSEHTCACNSTNNGLCRVSDGCAQRLAFQCVFCHFVLALTTRTASVFDAARRHNTRNVIIEPYKIANSPTRRSATHPTAKAKVCSSTSALPPTKSSSSTTASESVRVNCNDVCSGISCETTCAISCS